MRGGLRFGVVVLAACGSSTSDPAPAPSAPPPVGRAAPRASDAAAAPATAAPIAEATEPAAPAPYAALTPQWSSIRGGAGCFFFSGPDGRDDQLVGDATVERAGERVTLRINGVAFVGTYRGQALEVERRSVHEFGGRWTVHETIRGRYQERLMRARYHYEECQVGEACPGHCTLDATLVFAR